jgi:hypothetical protein
MLLLLDLIDWRFDEPEEQLELAFEWNGEFPPFFPSSWQKMEKNE